jgi:hypothetical protein
MEKGIAGKMRAIVDDGVARHKAAIRVAKPEWREALKEWATTGAERHAAVVGQDGLVSRVMRGLVD